MCFNSLFIEKNRKKITDHNFKKTLFLNLFSDWLDLAKEKILIAEGFISHRAVLISLNGLKDDLISISERILYLEYRVYLEEHSGSNLSTFEAKLLNVNYRCYLLDEYPELFNLAYNTVKLFINNINDIISNFLTDYSEIEKKLNVDTSEIEYIRMGLGDKHNKNKSVTLIKFINGNSLIYKPKNLDIECSFSNFVAYYNEIFLTEIYVPNILSKGDYAWVEYIEGSTHIENENKIYENLGHAISILYLLNATDIHFENIILNNKNGVVLIDCETLLYPIRNNFDSLKASVLSIGLLISKVKVGGNEVDFGALDFANDNAVQELSLKKEKIVVDEFNILISEENISFNKNNLLIHNEEVNIQDSVDILIKGFKVSYIFLMKNSTKILSFFEKTLEKSPVRYLIRDTVSYSHILHESFSPILLINNVERSSFLNQLNLPLDDSHHYNNILIKDIEALKRNDIPYYYCELKSTALKNEDGLDQKNFFLKSPFDSLKYRLKTCSKKDLEKQVLLIKYSFAQNSSRKSQKVFTDDYVKKNIISSYKFYENITGDNNFYFSLIKSFKIPSKYNIEYSDNDFLFGQFGDILYLAEANRNFPNKIINSLIFRLYLENMKKTFYSQSLGMSGIAGVIYSLSRLYRIYKDDTFIDDAIAFINSIEIQKLIKNKKNNGIIHGNAGLLIALIELSKLKKGLNNVINLIHITYKKIIKDAIKCSDGVYWMSEFNNSPLCGMSHGSSGIALSLSRYYQLFGGAECKKFIEDAINYENTFYDNKSSNWKDNRNLIKDIKKAYLSFGWSHGSPGIGLARIELIESGIFDSQPFLDILKNDLINCVESTIKNGFTGNDTVIYGKYGNAELIYRFAKISKKYNLLDDFENRINSFDNINLVQNNKGLFIPGLFAGISGCGHQLLYFNNMIKNSILTFECK